MRQIWAEHKLCNRPMPLCCTATRDITQARGTLQAGHMPKCKSLGIMVCSRLQRHIHDGRFTPLNPVTLQVQHQTVKRGNGTRLASSRAKIQKKKEKKASSRAQSAYNTGSMCKALHGQKQSHCIFKFKPEKHLASQKAKTSGSLKNLIMLPPFHKTTAATYLL